MVIKTVLPHLADAEYVARFRDEAKVVVKLSHGNLVPVFDAGLVGGELFLAMDFVEGRDLRAVWNRCAKKQIAFPIDVAVYIVKELCRGLGYAHSFPDLNLVHRDVSPPNVLVSYTGEVKLTDFGLASRRSSSRRPRRASSTARSRTCRPSRRAARSSTGAPICTRRRIVLWELLTGRQLFPPGKDQPQDLLSRAKNPEVMRPSKRAPRVPRRARRDLRQGARRASKEDRYADCEEMRMALQSWLAHERADHRRHADGGVPQELFAEDIVRERGERQELIARVRTRALTLPPTDELRQMIEKSDKVDIGPPMRRRRRAARPQAGLDRPPRERPRRRRHRSPQRERSPQSSRVVGRRWQRRLGRVARARDEEHEAPELGIGSRSTAATASSS